MRRLTNEDVTRIVEQTMRRALDLRATKSVEYAEDGDGLSTVRRIAIATGATMPMVVTTFMLKHVDAVVTHVRINDKTRHLTEPIEHRIDDAVLYLCLLKAALSEESGDG